MKKPSRPRTAYLLYGVKVREELEAQNPTLRFGELTMKMSETWKSLPYEEKRYYFDLEADDRERYISPCFSCSSNTHLMLAHHRYEKEKASLVALPKLRSRKVVEIRLEDCWRMGRTQTQWIRCCHLHHGGTL